MHRIHAFIFIALSYCAMAHAETVSLAGREFTIPDGFLLKIATAPGLTERPIVVDFDELGHLYVAESNGTNDNVQKQLKEKPHSILRLTDSNGDGIFDTKTVFADRMMFPEGMMCHQGSVYASAPPHIWKLTDTNDDGVADERKVWFDAKTLTGCANDLHGPYLGPDGWIYWCKGAFAEQTYERANGDSFVTSAAHIFRRRPEGGVIEPVMTGGMDNPVEVVFTPSGERIFTTTFFQHPANGQRDGLVHAIYGGVYGKPHGVINGHARTGDLMPVMTHLGAAAPSGLARLQSDSLGFRDHLLTACFNLHSVMLHELVPHGASFTTKDTELVTTKDLDFHPTDVIEDANGSLLIVDTGGWYKLCCPTSQLHKPDVSGAIYRLSKIDSTPITDARGTQIDWRQLKATQLADLLDDSRFAVRNRSMAQLSKIGPSALPAIQQVIQGSPSSEARLNAVWTACRIDTAEARTVSRIGLKDEDPAVRQAALHTASVWRDTGAKIDLLKLLDDESISVQRTAAEALGRLEIRSAVPKLIETLNSDVDRVLEHSLIYALIEINAGDDVRPALASGSARQKRAALLALHGMHEGKLSLRELTPFLFSDESELRMLATDIAAKHPEWSEALAALYRSECEKNSDRLPQFANQIGALSEQPAMSTLILELLNAYSTAIQAKVSILNSSTTSDERFDATLESFLSSGIEELVAAAVDNLARRHKDRLSKSLRRHLQAVANSTDVSTETRLRSAQLIDTLDANLFTDVTACLSPDQPARIRSLAVAALENAELSHGQLFILAGKTDSVSPLELSRLLRLFDSQTDDKLGAQLFNSLPNSSTAASLPSEQIAKLASQFGDETAQLAKKLLVASSIDSLEQSRRLEELLAALPPGDIRGGQQLFHSDKLACFSCHAVGYRGGNVGPDLSSIARTRSRRDLLEAIVYPNASFVRSYEPVNVITTGGEQLTGTIRDQSSEGLLLQLNATETQRVNSNDIEEILPSKVSIMPAGLDKLLTKKELSDLLAFLESRK